MGLDTVRGNFSRSLKVLLRFSVLAAIKEDCPQIIVGIGTLIVERQREPVPINCCVQFPPILQDQAEIVLGVDRPRPQADGGLKLFDRLGQLASLEQRAAELVPRERVVRRPSNACPQRAKSSRQ